MRAGLARCGVELTGALAHFLASNRFVPNRNVMFNIARRGELESPVKTHAGSALVRIAPRVAVFSVETVPSAGVVYFDRKDLGSVGTVPAQHKLEADTYTTATRIAVAIGETKPTSSS